MTFYVHASNIHTDAAATFGPFPGEPGLTYELLRCFGDGDAEIDGDEIFQYDENHDIGFIHQDDGEIVRYGWRRSVRQPVEGHPGSFFQRPVGKVWTDLSIAFDPDCPQHWVLTSNEIGSFAGQPEYDPNGGDELWEQAKPRELVGATARTTWGAG